MSESLRKGWCPGALRPMPAKDGLLVRLRITGGILPAATADALAALAARYGNGLFDLSARGNLQMRGVLAASLLPLQDGLITLGLLDRDVSAESIRNVIASPLAGLHGGLDIRRVVAALETRLAADTILHALPGKFGFLVDDGSAPSLADVEADVRFDWMPDEGLFAVGLAGSRDAAILVGWCTASEVATSAAAIGRWALASFAKHPGARRMCHLVAVLGARGLSDACRVEPLHDRGSAKVSRPNTSADLRDLVGPRTFDGVPTLCLAAPFGRLDTTMLRAAAALAAATPVQELRLTPWRVLLVPHASAASRELAPFITDPADRRLSIAACVGAEGCVRGTTPTRTDAARLARHLGAPGASIGLHVSGCAKGCAKASSSPVTLVARDGCYDLVRDGRADDPPLRRNLDLDAICAALDDLMAPA